MGGLYGLGRERHRWHTITLPLICSMVESSIMVDPIGRGTHIAAKGVGQGRALVGLFPTVSQFFGGRTGSNWGLAL